MSSATLLPEPERPLTTIRRIAQSSAARPARRCRARAQRNLCRLDSGGQLRAVPVARSLRIAVFLLVTAHLLVELVRQEIDRSVHVVLHRGGVHRGASEADSGFGLLPQLFYRESAVDIDHAVGVAEDTAQLLFDV